MKRRLLKLAIFLLLGAVVNVAVAWGCALWSPPSHPEQPDCVLLAPESEWASIDARQPPLGLGHDEEEWLAKIGVDLSVTPILYRDEKLGFGMRWVSFHLSVRSLWYYTGWRRVECGWPVYSFAGRENPNYSGLHGSSAESWLLIHLPDLLGRIVPYPAIWPGLAFNTIFYGAILWLAIPGPFALRRLIRRKRGLCVKCGYDLRGNLEHGCPECGWRRDEHTNRSGTIGA